MKNILTGKWVFDSNLLVYFLDEKSSFFEPTKQLFSLIIIKQITGILAHQNILEAENVFITKYKLNKDAVLDSMEKVVDSFYFELISPSATTFEQFNKLYSSSTAKTDIYDYYLAATMLDNGINRILTGNSKDFSRIPGIEVVNPFV